LILNSIAPVVAARADAIRDQQWFLNFLDASKAQTISRGAGTTVAVVDDGVDGNHPDLSGNVLSGAVTIAGQPGDGWNDSDGHGTNMAGLIAGHGHSSDGVLGIAPEAKILPLQYASAIVRGIPESMASAIDIAVQRGARVISVSQGGVGSEVLKAAVDRAQQANVVIVAAAGNKPESSVVDWPAHYSGVVAVGAVDQSGQHA
jgi:subtilisin family serine protease